MYLFTTSDSSFFKKNAYELCMANLKKEAQTFSESKLLKIWHDHSSTSLTFYDVPSIKYSEKTFEQSFDAFKSALELIFNDSEIVSLKEYDDSRILKYLNQSFYLSPSCFYLRLDFLLSCTRLDNFERVTNTMSKLWFFLKTPLPTSLVKLAKLGEEGMSFNSKKMPMLKIIELYEKSYEGFLSLNEKKEAEIVRKKIEELSNPKEIKLTPSI